MDDPDAIWKPGYDGPPPPSRFADDPPADTPWRATPNTADHPTPTDEAPSGDARRAAHSRGRRLGIAVGIAAVVFAAAAIVLDPFGRRDDPAGEDPGLVGADAGTPADTATDGQDRPRLEPPDPTVVGGPAARRLPSSSTTLWSAEIAHDGDHWVEVIGRDLVIAAVVRSEPEVVALDALTGAERWVTSLDVDPDRVHLLAAADGVLVLEHLGVDGSTLTGIDTATGERRWTNDTRPTGGYVGLEGTPFIAELPTTPEQAVAVIDVGSGDVAGTFAADAVDPDGWTTDRSGTWYIAEGADLVEYDLAATFGDATVVAALDDPSAPSIVVDDRTVTVDDTGSIAIRPQDPDRDAVSTGEVPSPVLTLTPVTDSNFVVSAPGSITGVAVENDTATVTWERDRGVVVDHHPVAGGTLLQVATRGGAATELVDGGTGATVANLTMLPGALQALVVTADGFVTLRSSQFGARVAGVDLDGAEQWAIPGSEPVIVGDRVVVRPRNTGAETEGELLRLVAHGDAS